MGHRNRIGLRHQQLRPIRVDDCLTSVTSSHSVSSRESNNLLVVETDMSTAPAQGSLDKTHPIR